jgi:hypothetical protein
MRELEPYSEVAWRDRQEPLTWLATLATLSPGKRVATRLAGEQSQNVYENKGQNVPDESSRLRTLRQESKLRQYRRRAPLPV